MQTVSQEETLYCVNHPKTETVLRCSKCLDPICMSCAVRTPVGLRCPKCTGAQQSRDGRYYVPSLLTQVSRPQLFKAGMAALGMAVVGGIAWGQFRFAGGFSDWSFWFALLLALLIAEVVARLSNERRGTALQIIASGSVFLAAMIALAWSAFVVNEIQFNQLTRYLSDPFVREQLGMTITNAIFVGMGMIVAAFRLKE